MSSGTTALPFLTGAVIFVPFGSVTITLPSSTGFPSLSVTLTSSEVFPGVLPTCATAIEVSFLLTVNSLVSLVTGFITPSLPL